MEKLLKLKHWQLFLLIVGIPLVVDIFFAVPMSMGENFIPLNFVFVFAGIFVMGIYFGWIYALGTCLHKLLPDNTTLNLTRFKIFLLIPLLYIIVLSAIMAYKFNTYYVSEDIGNPQILTIIIPLHLFSMFGIFYSFYFAAKTLKSVEWKRSVTFADYAGEFFLIWFFPIGIWILQPRINKLIQGEDELPSDFLK